MAGDERTIVSASVVPEASFWLAAFWFLGLPLREGGQDTWESLHPCLSV